MIVITNRKPNTPSTIQLETVKQAEVFLQTLPEKQREYLSLRQAVKRLLVPLETAYVKGYSYEELAAILHDFGISISASTLRNYIPLARQQSPENLAPNVDESKSSRKTPQMTSDMVEVKAPAKASSTYRVKRDFWEAYQESLREREEVYRRLAES
jgi:hypothetical protein